MKQVLLSIIPYVPDSMGRCQTVDLLDVDTIRDRLANPRKLTSPEESVVE